ncbi:ATP-binding protein [Streptacidiphilus sp. MAP12-33]|uniref:ATP-binding protein n=1 Tax=Streptacidiphilus sp. MAP12-33 TaxID=3156266 RepID=UPI003512951A
MSPSVGRAPARQPDRSYPRRPTGSGSFEYVPVRWATRIVRARAVGDRGGQRPTSPSTGAPHGDHHRRAPRPHLPRGSPTGLHRLRPPRDHRVRARAAPPRPVHGAALAAAGGDRGGAGADRDRARHQRVRHSGGPDVTLRLCAAAGALTVQVSDSGHWRPRISPPDDDTPCGGRGLLLVQTYATTCTVHASPHGTTVTAELLLPLPA